MRVERSAPWKAHNIVQESQRTGEGAVLIVNCRVHMPAVCIRDEGRGGLIIGFIPRTHYDFLRELPNLGVRLGQRQHHKEPRMPREALSDKGPRQSLFHASATAIRHDEFRATVGVSL